LSEALSLPAPPADEWLSERERWTALVDALSRLPESDQALIRAYYVDEVSSREIQARTQLSAGAIRVRLSRARAVLRERLAPLLAALGVLDSVRAPRSFGEVPKGSNRMGVTGSVACSLAVVGWLGFGAYQVEEAVLSATSLAPLGDTLAQIELIATEDLPAAESGSASGAEGATGWQVSATDEEQQSMAKELDVAPTRTVSTVVGTLHARLLAAGHPEWSPDRLYGVLGHAFTFEMKEDGGDVWQEAQLDYGHGSGFFEMLPALGSRIRRFDGVRRGEQDDFQALKTEAWNAVKASIDRGVPALVWQPMTQEMKDEGIRAGAWGMLIGYDESDETYAVRHQYIGRGRETYAVRYDALGYAAAANWFCVLVYDGSESADATAAHLRSLQNAVAFANDTRWPPTTGHHAGEARGLAAYPVWREAIQSGVAPPEYSQYHANDLRVFRGHAAAYLRELVGVFPTAESDLREAAGHYDQLTETAATIHDLCANAKEGGGFSDEARSETATLIATALAADQAAIGRIEAALAVLDESQ